MKFHGIPALSADRIVVSGLGLIDDSWCHIAQAPHDHCGTKITVEESEENSSQK